MDAGCDNVVSGAGLDNICDYVVSDTHAERAHAERAHAERAYTGGASSGAGAASKVLSGLTTTTDECAEDIDHAAGTPCASRKIIKAVAAFAAEIGAEPAPRADAPLLPSAATPEADAVRAAAAALRCDSESCVIGHASLHSFAESRRIASAGEFSAELERRFKARGPRDSTALLSNYNIDETLQRWARTYPEFFPCPFAMMDFETNGDLFGEIDLADVVGGRVAAHLGSVVGSVRRPFACFGCVLNTDTSRGPGKHWVAVFVDCRAKDAPWTVEYFNSAGHPPPKPVVRWMEKARAQLAPAAPAAGVLAVPVTDMDHQESQTECGLYALFYIRRRLEGTPYAFFLEQVVPDAAMTTFRQHVFRAA